MQNKTFFFTDIHGHYPLFRAIIDWCGKNTIIYGGDAADRGKNGYQIIKELVNATNVIYLYGNHEQLFVQAADAIIGAYSNNKLINNGQILSQMRSQEQVQLHIYNGGENTLKDWLLDQANLDIINKLRFLPRTYSYKNLDFCHAGSTYSMFKEGSKKPLPQYVETALIWDRNCIPMGWEKDRIGVFGHTPTIHLPAKVYGRDKSLANIHPCMWGELLGGKNKRGGYKIDMDTGAYGSNRAFVLDCDTLQTYCFEYNEKTKQITITEYELKRP